ncbi:hypothetical protein LINGRAHAP2_LOCUS14573 [Linum grandiflorum]
MGGERFSDVRHLNRLNQNPNHFPLDANRGHDQEAKALPHRWDSNACLSDPRRSDHDG